AGMTELIRPALYHAYHKIENLSAEARVAGHATGGSTGLVEIPAGDVVRPGAAKAAEQGDEFVKYDVVGPICESSDCFGKGVELPETRRGDLIAIRTAGAYGEVMTSTYNLRPKMRPLFL